MPTTSKRPARRRTPEPEMEEQIEMTAQDLPDFGSLVPRQEKKKIVWFWPVAAIVIVIALTYSLLNYYPGKRAYEGYQSVFLTNGQVYFGQIASEDSHYIYMTDVYYIQVQEQLQPGLNEGDEPTRVQVPTLLKRGQELHAPDGLLQLNREQVIAIEHVGEASQLMSQIQQMEAAQ